MKSPLILLALAALSLSACGYSVADAVEDIKDSDNGGFADGKTISTDDHYHRLLLEGQGAWTR